VSLYRMTLCGLANVDIFIQGSLTEGEG
jgi:hypothetical protein